MAFFNRNKPAVESLGALMAQPEMKARSKDIAEQSKGATKKEYSADRITTLFGKEGSLGKSGVEKNKGFFAGIKERMMSWGKKRQGEASAKMLDYGRNFINAAPDKVEYSKDEAPAKVEQAKAAASEKVVSITSGAEQGVDRQSQLEQKLIEALQNYNTAAKNNGGQEIVLMANSEQKAA